MDGYEEMLEEAAKRAISDLVGVLSSSLTSAGKRSRLIRIGDDIKVAVYESCGDKKDEVKSVYENITSNKFVG